VQPNEASLTVMAEKRQRFLFDALLFDSRKKKEDEKVLARFLDRSKLLSSVLATNLRLL
jgi:hypothetical protein